MAQSQGEGSNFQNRAPSDVFDPLFLHPSDHPGMLLVTKQDGTNFGSWKKSISIALSAKNKLSFVQGLIVKPSAGDMLISSWQRCNDMVTSWILNTLTSDIAESVLFSESACQIWRELEDRYGQASGANMYQLHKEAVSMEHNTSDIAAYYSRFKKVHDEFSTLKSFPPCSCGHAQALAKFEEDQRLIQFLMGLNGSYGAIRGNILMMKPLPTINQAYAILMQEEKQREVYTKGSMDTDATACVANQRSNATPSMYTPSMHEGEGRRLDKGRIDMKRSTLICHHCKKSGHTANKCYKLIGYPRDFRSARGRRVASGVQLGYERGQQTTDEEDKTKGISLSGEEYNQLMQLVSQVQMADREDYQQDMPTSHAHFAGPFMEDSTGSW